MKKERLFGALLAAAAVPAMLMTTAGTADASTTARYIRYGDSGFAVKCVQWAWNDFAASETPYPEQPLVVDGVFGDLTLAAVQEYQRTAHIAVDGVVGPDTGNYMWTNRLYKNHTDCYNYIPTKS